MASAPRVPIGGDQRNFRHYPGADRGKEKIMAEDQDLPMSAPDENQAPYAPSDMAPICYHCPNTTCDGHYYLASRDLGREMICPKCRLPVTIGKRRAQLW